MTKKLDFLRDNVLRKRLGGVAGGNRIFWSEKDMADIHDHVLSAKLEQLVHATHPIETKQSAEPVDFSKLGIEVRSEIGATDNPVFIISSPRIDLAGDSVDVGGIELADFKKNSAVLDSHDSTKPPVAISTSPWISGDKMLAIARFPAPGVSNDSDRIAAAIRAGLVRGASIGFIPTKWSFSKDPARPLGVNFNSIKLLEWSICAIPANPDALLVGSVAGGASSTSVDPKTAERIREARRLTEKARQLCSAPKTRVERIAEAAEFRRKATGS